MFPTLGFQAATQVLGTLLVTASALAGPQQDPAPAKVDAPDLAPNSIKQLVALPGESACPRDGFALLDADGDGQLDLTTNLAWGSNRCAQCHSGSSGTHQTLLTFTSPTGDIHALATFNSPTSDLGAALAAVDEPLRSQLKLPEGRGVVVVSLTADGPASRAGLKENDLLLSIGDVPVSNPENVLARLKSVGETSVELAIIRDGEPTTLRVRPRFRITLDPAEPETPEYYIGVAVAPIDDVLRAHLKALPADAGLIVTEVVEGSPAAKVGVQNNDILFSFRGEPIAEFEALAKLVQEAGPHPGTLELLRGGEPIEFEITPTERPESEATPLIEATLVRESSLPRESWITTLDPTLGWAIVNPTLGWANVNNRRVLAVPNPAVVAESFVADSRLSGVQKLVDEALAKHLWEAAAEEWKTYRTGPDDSSRRRLDALSAEVKALREAVDALRKAVEESADEDGGR